MENETEKREWVDPEVSELGLDETGHGGDSGDDGFGVFTRSS